MPLTTTEEKSFTAAKLAQINRLSDAEVDAYIILDLTDYKKLPGESTAEFDSRKSVDSANYRAKVLGRWANMTVEQLRARVNINSVGTPGVGWSTKNDYTAEEQAAIVAGYKPNVGRKMVSEVPAVLAEYTALQADGFTSSQALGILRNR